MRTHRTRLPTDTANNDDDDHHHHRIGVSAWRIAAGLGGLASETAWPLPFDAS
jgi:hypothetical protein